MTLHPEFVEFLPRELEEGILYISMKYNAVGHKCPCGCGNLVFTPLSPVDWQLFYDGKGVTLEPSIGNWSFKCQSHYWIENNKVILARKWNEREIAQVRELEMKKKKKWFKKRK